MQEPKNGVIMLPMNMIQSINNFHFNTSPSILLAKVQRASNKSTVSLAVSSMEDVINKAENAHLLWLERKKHVLEEMEQAILSWSDEERHQYLPEMIEYFDELIEEDEQVALTTIHYFKRQVKVAKRYDSAEAKKMQKIGERHLTLAKSSIEALLSVQDHIVALKGIYVDSHEKGTNHTVDAEQINTAEDIHQWLMNG